MKREKKTKHFGLLRMFIFVLFAAGLLNSGISTFAVFLLVKKGILIVSNDAALNTGTLLAFSATLSIPVGLAVAVAVSKFPLRPIRELIDGMNRLASGDFKTRVSVGKIMRRYPAFVDVSESFNKMAEELESTEMLRVDFINNFSHEFKTPIVSIAGFAKLLKRGNLTDQQRLEYLTAIEEESMRLSYMATNVLNLTKVENQTILTDKTEFNLSEQLRSCVLLLESEWTKKDLELQLEFDEHTIRASEELLKEVWINLLDNAIKFAPAGHTVQVKVSDFKNDLRVFIRNTGSEIEPAQQKKIFNKFYQADESHAAKGNGVGLAIVKRIIALHGGEVMVSSANDVTTFMVSIPKE